MIHVIACPKCKRQYKISADPAGKQMKCPSCQAVFRASTPAAKPPAQPQPQTAKRPQLAQAGPIQPLAGSPKLFPDQPVVPQGNDPLANHVISDPGFAQVDVEEIRRRRAEEEKKIELDQAFFSTSALAKMKDEQQDKQSKKKSKYLNGDVLFSFEGRICRKTFWLASLLLAVVEFGVLFAIFGTFLFIAIVTDTDLEGSTLGLMFQVLFGVIGFVAVILNTWISLALYIKRYHDLGKSGTWVLISLIPLVGIWMVIECGFFPGDRGKNYYGPPDPNYTRR